MLSLSGKLADRIAARQVLKNKPPVKSVPKRPSKKLSTALKGGKGDKLKKSAVKRKKILDKKAEPKALLLSRKKVSAGLKKLNLKSAGFGRYNKGKGTPVVRWAMRNPKTGLYVLADKKLRALLLGKKKVDAPAGANKPAKSVVAKKPIGRPTNARKAHETTKANLTKMHLDRLDRKRAETLKAKGKTAEKPMTKREQHRRDVSVRKLHRVLDAHFKQEQASRRAKKESVRSVLGKH